MFRNWSWHATLARSTALVSASMLAIPTLVPVMTPAQAQTQDIWTGAVSSDWFTAGNWQDGSVPGAGDDVDIDTAAPNGIGAVVDSASAFGGPQATVGIIVVGRTSTGVLTIRNGGILEGVVQSGQNEIGQNPGSQGTVTVTGPGSLWSMDRGLSVGPGSLAIEDGGRVTAIGTTQAPVNIKNGGTVTVTGPDSRLETNDILDVGLQRAGTLAIAAGGVVTSARGVVGDTPNSTGTVTVTGPGSRWSMDAGLAGDDPPPGALVIGFEGTGTVTVADGGVVSTSGPITIAREAGSTGTLNIGAAPGETAAPAGDVQAAAIAFGAGSGTINFNHTSADYVFAPAVSGAGSVNQLAGTTILTAANTYTGPTTINGGTLAVNGSITSPTSINTGGTLGGTGLVNANVLNRGRVAPGNSIGTLTITGNYVGSGGILEIESVLAGNSSPTDRLRFDGGSASGSTGVEVINLNGPGGLTSGNGIPVVVAENGATTTSSAFSLAGPVAAGVYQYELRRGEGSAEAEQSWYLASHKKGTGPQPGPDPQPVPLYRPEASVYSALPAMARAQSLAALGTFHERQGDQGLVRRANNDRAWGRVFAQHTEQHHEGLLDARFDGDMSGLQVGLDALRFTSPSGYETAAGLFFAYAHSEGDAYGHNLGIPNNFAGKPELDGASVGAYWTRLAPNGAYVDAVAMATHYDTGGKSINNVEIDADGTGLMASLEAGYPILLGWRGLTLEPQAQAIYQHLAFDRANDPFSTVDFDTDDAVVGRLGLRLSGAFGTWRPYLKANLWHDWVDEDTATYANVHVVDSEHASTALELGGGLVADLGPRWGLWADAAYTQDIDGEERDVVRGTAGLRMRW